MDISIETRQAYTEIDNFLEVIDNEYKNKIPKQLREIFKTEKDTNYIKNIDVNRAISEQNLKKETLAIIALLNLQYWCTNEKEKENLKQVYAKNENRYQQELREKYNPENIFKRDTQEKKVEQNIVQNETSIVEYRKSVFKQIINKLKQIIKI